MNINKYILLLIFSVSLLANDTLSVDVKKSTLHWIGKKVSGEHDGNVSIKEGFVVLKKGEIENAEIIVDMNSITVLDIDSPKWNQSLVDHLKDDDFFGVDSFPTATIKIKSSKKYKSKLNPQYNRVLDGVISIKGIEEPIAIRSNFSLDDSGSYRAIGLTEIDRTKFGIHYKSKSIFPDIGDKFIYDNFILEFDIYTK